MLPCSQADHPQARGGDTVGAVLCFLVGTGGSEVLN